MDTTLTRLCNLDEMSGNGKESRKTMARTVRGQRDIANITRFKKKALGSETDTMESSNHNDEEKPRRDKAWEDHGTVKSQCLIQVCTCYPFYRYSRGDVFHHDWSISTRGICSSECTWLMPLLLRSIEVIALGCLLARYDGEWHSGLRGGKDSGRAGLGNTLL